MHGGQCNTLRAERDGDCSVACTKCSDCIVLYCTVLHLTVFVRLCIAMRDTRDASRLGNPAAAAAAFRRQLRDTDVGASSPPFDRTSGWLATQNWDIFDA